ncbi:MAG: aminotransferase class IV [Desulfobacterales bacterium]
MKHETVGDVYFVCHELRSCGDTEIFDRIGPGAIYEVIKLIEGIPLFFEAHMDRLKRSADLAGERVEKNEAEIWDEIHTLVEKNRKEHINVKLICCREKKGELFLTYFIRSEYPGPDVYAKGIRTVLYGGEREMPNIKTLRDSFRARVEGMREKTGAYEALLVDQNGYVTEGSRSNIFFVKQGEIFTPPAGTVLLGVTRQHVVKICKSLGLNFREHPLHRSELGKIDGAFITGTTVDVLPVSHVDEISLSSVSHPLVQKIVEAFAKEISSYIRERKTRRESGTSGGSR